MRLDHLAICGADLARATAWAEERLGVAFGPGGRHDRYATHNRLVRLGEGEYLEVIAPDPDAPAPEGPRWFGLDHADAPALGNWICASDDLAADREGPFDMGVPVALARGDLRWTILVPEDGSLPMAGGAPTLIEWTSGAHPATRLPDAGLRLLALTVSHPEAEALAARFAPRLTDPRITFRPGPPGLSARFSTPRGEVTL